MKKSKKKLDKSKEGMVVGAWYKRRNFQESGWKEEVFVGRRPSSSEKKIFGVDRVYVNYSTTVFLEKLIMKDGSFVAISGDNKGRIVIPDSVNVYDSESEMLDKSLKDKNLRIQRKLR